MKKMMLCLMLAAVAVSVSGCNTVSGLGRDITGSAETVRGWF